MGDHYKTATRDGVLDESVLPETCPACGNEYTAIVSGLRLEIAIESGAYCLVEGNVIDEFVFHDPEVIPDEK